MMLFRFTYLSLVLVASIDAQTLYSECNFEDYYSGLPTDISTWTREVLGPFLKSTHRNFLPYTHSSKEDVWDALKDLDTCDGVGDTVHLIYKDTCILADETQGTTTGWNREHIWPKSLGVGTNGADMTDVHHLRPADWNVNAARGNKYFGDCGIARAASECDSPAHAEAAPSTAEDPSIWRAPTNMRGDIARSVFYMQIRYFGDGTDPNLQLTDCPSETNEMGYLSVLLEWHAADPVDAEELERNDRVCSRWQGNRNPFVDFPSLATQLYGVPQDRPTDGGGYSQCQPPPPSAPSSCEELSPGDLQMVAVMSDNPDLIAVVALGTIPEGVDLYLTDKAWMGTEFRSYEGIQKMTVPTGGIAAGTVFGFGDSSLMYNNLWSTQSGSFSLSASGDSIIIYCLDSSTADFNFLTALSYKTSTWNDPNLSSSDYGSGGSALPLSLVDSSISLPHYDNYVYEGITSGSATALKSALTTSSNWVGSNARPATYAPPTFTVLI